MNLSLISLLFILNTFSTKTPNFYPSYIAAKEASKNYQKDLLIFFSKNACSECTAAWTNFEKDQLGTKIFISTIIDMQDFDGAVILDKYGLNSAPSWVILDSEGKVKQTWAGEWKNPHVRPTGTTPEATKPAPIPATPVVAAPKQTPPVTASVTSEPVKTAEPVKPAVQSTPALANTTAPAPAPVKPVAALVTTEVVVSGYVLQAGYFGSEANALKLVDDLRTKGFEQYTIKTLTQNGSMFYRVISKTYPTEAEANTVVQSLSASGIKATVKKQSEI